MLKKALNFASRRVEVKEGDKEIVFQARKSLLFNKGQAWMKKEGDTFDVTMGAYDGAEVCELVGSYILHQLGSKYKKENLGLYRDDGLAIFENISGPEAERIKKDFQKVFKRNGLNITIQSNLKVVDYLDVTFNLNNGTYMPYRKPNNTTTYIHKESNHSPNILSKLPGMIERRISDLSATKEIFENSKDYYEEALKKSGFDGKLNYNQPQPNLGRRRNRKRNIIWFNPPYSKNVKTKIAEEFLKLIDKHFHERHKYRKQFNRNNVKVSYSSMPNMASIINGHNRKILNDEQAEERTCNCRNPGECPLEGKCLTKEILYEATVTADLPRYEVRTYKGITARAFKERLKEHKKSFNNKKLMNETELSKEIWRIKDRGGTSNVKWKMVKRARSYNPQSKRCLLCITEKLAIAEHEGRDMLNKRSEAVAKCRHQNRYSLANM